jgi:uncharacterized protein YidB (DUF937 family)
MGILDNLAGMLGGGGDQSGEQAGGAMNIVQQLMQQGGEGQSSGIVSALLGAVGGQGGAGAPQGGMAGMLETLAANGLGEQVSSWVSNNPNLPISPDQIRSALGSDQVQQMASATGLPVGDFLKHLAEHLPQAAAEQAGTAAS